MEIQLDEIEFSQVSIGEYFNTSPLTTGFFSYQKKSTTSHDGGLAKGKDGEIREFFAYDKVYVMRQSKFVLNS